MNSGYLQAIREYLDKQGMTFEPLRDEMLDHISCDIERLIQKGSSFEDAWQQVLNEIPPKQLHTIQIETMETVNKKESLSKWFAYLSFFLLFAGSAFKLLKFPGAGQLLIASFMAIALALLSGSVLGVIAHQEKKGSWLVLSVVAAVLMFMASFTFQILRLPGATELRLIAVMSLGIIFVISFFTLRGNADHLLPWLHKRYTPIIDRFMLILVAAAFALRLPSLMFSYDDPVSRTLLVMAITSVGLHFHALNWSCLQEIRKRGLFYPLVLSISFLCFLLPAIVQLNAEVRSVLVTILWPVAGIIAVVKGVDGEMRQFALVSTALITIVLILCTCIGVGILPISLGPIAYNATILLGLVLLFIVFRRSVVYRTYLMLVLCHYLFVYPWEIGLW